MGILWKEWKVKEYPSDEIRAKEYYKDIEAIVKNRKYDDISYEEFTEKDIEIKEGFRDPEDYYGFDELATYEIDDYEVGDKVVVAKGLTTDPLNKQGETGVVSKIDPEKEIVYVTFKGWKTGGYSPGTVVFPGDEDAYGVDYDEEFTDEDDANQQMLQQKMNKIKQDVRGKSNDWIMAERAAGFRRARQGIK